MNIFRPTLATVAACGLFLSATSAAFAAPKDYQITGEIVALTDTTISVKKGSDAPWEIGRGADTKLPDGAKVGDKVTVHYSMVAGAVEAKAAPAAKETKEKKPAKGKAAAATSSKAGTEPAASGSPSKPAAEAASPTP